ncbi:MAG: DUF262 domain-containing protein [Okeania sp. SIO3I5]|uniref:GmrSD restriction endonuclease domain-containing protein n=1 Tax=Okeania sp. SIO3I5 TaxID=2607805 RepID=UPI0013BA91B5|nr:DUF262 domain-containing protein [Okeania sp. SIO3I5]NEQ39136.1 DUF262 domain-containing protein [Okeania sp. SIO3I5]
MFLESPEANPKILLDIIKSAVAGKVVIPDFQRSFVWKKDDIQDLLTSLLQGYFIGIFLMLDTPRKNPMFPFRSVEGMTEKPNVTETVTLVLDGQQRITSLYYALYEPNQPLKGAKNPYRFYLVLESVLDNDLESAVIGISERDSRRRKEYDELVKQHKALPFSLLRDSGTFNKWLYREQNIWGDKEQELLVNIYNRLDKFMVPVISLSSETREEDIVNIFERINRTGLSLSLFDLAVAKLYKKGVKLRDLWDKVQNNYQQVTALIKPEFLLRLIALRQGKEPKKGNLLRMTGEIEGELFEKLWHEAVNSIVTAYQRLVNVYGAFDSRWIPYTTLIIPLAALLNKINRVSAGAEAYQKLDCWYWGCILGQRYENAVDSKIYNDFQNIGRWIDNQGNPPEWLQKLSVQSFDLKAETLYKGLMGLIACEGSKDFLTGQPAEINKCQDDHIFPKSRYQKYDFVNSILNRTLISQATNRCKTNKLPADFLDDCLAKHGGNEEQLLETLASHFIDENGYAAMQNNDFISFINSRQKVMQKKLQEIVSLAEPIEQLEAVSEDEVTYWLTPVAANEERSASEQIKFLVGEEKIYAFGDKTPGRKSIKSGDNICFYASGKGIVAHALVKSKPEKSTHPKIFNSDRYPWVFELEKPCLYLDNPVVLDEDLRNKLDAFLGRGDRSTWSWFVQVTRKISANDFIVLTRDFYKV